MEEQSDSVDESKDLEHKIKIFYYRLKKILEDENLIEVVDD